LGKEFILSGTRERKIADANELLRAEFNRWAEQGRGEEMERNHLSLALQVIARMALKAGDRVLDLSCGAGWATRLLAQAVAGGQGMAAGLDISEEMICRARAASRDVENALFAIGSAEEIPWRDEYFERIFSIESFYYYPDQEAVLREIHRVLVPGGFLFILINFYEENPHSHGWADRLKVPVHLRSEAEYEKMLRAQGFVDITMAHIPDLTESSGQCSDAWFANEEQAQAFRRIGGLLLTARRP
jgi:ubiquinone/menaquinone biosynthesis C-methylase UbiE